MKIHCPICHRDLDTLDADYIPAHAHTPLLGERCVGGDKSPVQALVDAKAALTAARKKVNGVKRRQRSVGQP